MEFWYEEVVNLDEMIILDIMLFILLFGQQEEGVQWYEINVEFMLGVKLIVLDRFMKIMMNDIEVMSFDVKFIVYFMELDFYWEVLMNLFLEGMEVREVLVILGNGILDILKKINFYIFLFFKILMKWDVEYQFFVFKEEKIGVVFVVGEFFNKMLEVYVEYKMLSNEDDCLYIYIKLLSELFYFFGFKQGIMSIIFNNFEFMDVLGGMKSKELIIKMDDGNIYEIQVVDVGLVWFFFNWVKVV